VTKSFQLVGGQPVVDLVNTLDWRFRESGAEDLLNTYDDLLRFTEQTGLLTPRQARALRRTEGSAGSRALQQARELRESAAQVFYAMIDRVEPPVEAVLRLDRYMHTSQASRVLRWTPSGVKLIWAQEADALIPVWLLGQAAADVLTSATVSKLRACADAGCRWLFLDTSKNHMRRWCDMKVCGNRTKARRFREQRSAS
jgi:predicted RNA-binding Zn ribbon-like protein